MYWINYKIENNVEKKYVTTVVHKFKFEYWEDPDIEMAPIYYGWAQSPEGKYIFEHADNPPELIKTVLYHTMEMGVAIVATMEEKWITEYCLKFGKTVR